MNNGAQTKGYVPLCLGQWRDAFRSSFWINDTKKKSYLRLALAWLGHNSRKRLCRQEEEVMGECVHHWVVVGGLQVWIGLPLRGQTVWQSSPSPLRLQALFFQAGSPCSPPLWLDAPDSSWIVALDISTVVCPNMFLENKSNRISLVLEPVQREKVPFWIYFMGL